MQVITAFFDLLRGVDALGVATRLTLAVIFGGIIGIERGRKRRPAGFRTYILVCLGAALAMCTGQYLFIELGQTTDVSRLGAQVINGIGFLGAGTIIVTTRQQVKGLTTAAGLWASACMGLSIGAGYYECAIMAFLTIMATITVLNYLERALISRTYNMNVNVIITETACLPRMLDKLREMKIKIYDVEVTNVREFKEQSPNVAIEMRLPQRRPHIEIITTIAAIDGVISVEET